MFLLLNVPGVLLNLVYEHGQTKEYNMQQGHVHFDITFLKTKTINT